MQRRKWFYVGVLLAILLALPATALAQKQIFTASLRTTNELHAVTGSSATGSAILGLRPEGPSVFLVVRNLSGPATGIHLHAPATASQTAGVVVTLCGAPAPSVFGNCPAPDGNNQIVLQGPVPATHTQGMTPGEFLTALDAGLVYVNVHTSLNPSGEVRGQLERVAP
jgi:hypothetical protein